VPVVAGAGAVGRILIGVALIAASIFIPGSTAIFATTFGEISLSVGLFGASLVLGGIAQLLTPTPKISQDEGDPRKSFSFSGIQNTNRAGVPVPVVYGETLVGSVVISAGIDIVQVSA
jgi:predicted phage tail protein